MAIALLLCFFFSVTTLGGPLATYRWYHAAHFLVQTAELRPDAHFQEVCGRKLHRQTGIEPFFHLLTVAFLLRHLTHSLFFCKP